MGNSQDNLYPNQQIYMGSEITGPNENGFESLRRLGGHQTPNLNQVEIPDEDQTPGESRRVF